MIVLAAVIVVSGLGFGVYYISREQQRDYDKGHAAYLAGDCAKALGPLGEAVEGSDAELSHQAEREVDECKALLAADALGVQGRQSEAVLSYSAFVTDHATSPIVDVAVHRGQALLSEGPPERVGTVELCTELDDLDAQGFVAVRTALLPSLLLACGDAYADAGDFATALGVLDRIRHDFPDDAVMSDVEAAYVRVTLAQADATGSNELPAPNGAGASDSADRAVLVIRNASPEPMTIVLHGPQDRLENIEPCATCETHDTSDFACPDEVPFGRYELPAGTYDVVIKTTTETNVLPHRGTWTLAPGSAYADCYGIVNRS